MPIVICPLSKISWYSINSPCTRDEATCPKIRVWNSPMPLGQIWTFGSLWPGFGPSGMGLMQPLLCWVTLHFFRFYCNASHKSFLENEWDSKDKTSDTLSTYLKDFWVLAAEFYKLIGCYLFLNCYNILTTFKSSF